MPDFSTIGSAIRQAPQQARQFSGEAGQAGVSASRQFVSYEVGKYAQKQAEKALQVAGRQSAKGVVTVVRNMPGLLIGAVRFIEKPFKAVLSKVRF